MVQPPSDLDIAIVGMACRFPGAGSPGEFWRNLMEGRESIVPLSEDELRSAGVPERELRDPAYVPVHAPIPDLKKFDAGFFGFSPREAAILDPQHRHFLEVAWSALEDGAHVPSRFSGPIGVFAGSGHHRYLHRHLLTNPALLDDVGFFLLRHTGNDKDFLASRVSYLFDLRGPAVGVQTACSTSLVAVHLGVQSLLSRECDMALAGGVTIELPEGRGYRHAEGEILSPDGHCRPFDALSAGTVFGSGCGVVVLRRLEDAVRDGDPIHGVIKGTAVNNDGSRKVGYLAPSVDGQVEVAREALAVAGVDPGTVSYIEAHGTGTAMGDPIEVAALAEAYGTSGGRPPVALGSVKGNIGHLDTAAGVAGLVKVVEAMKDRRLPATLHFREPNPECDLQATPFSVLTEPRSWDAPRPLRASVNSLGVGGTNAHVVVEEAPVRPMSSRGNCGPYLLPLSARSPAALRGRARDLAAHLQAACSQAELADVAWTLQVGREHMRYRMAVTAQDLTEAVEALSDAESLARVEQEVTGGAPSVTFLFAGGGVQSPGMGRDLYRDEAVFRQVMDRGFERLERDHGIALKELLFPEEGHAEGAGAELERPSRSLPGIFMVQAATAELWRSWGIRPDRLMGHSMGEYTAAVEAGVLEFTHALDIVVKRGQLFETIPSGGMVSVALPALELEPLLAGGLALAAENGPALSVVSGTKEALDELVAELDRRTVEWSRIRIEVAAHSPLLDPILGEWGCFLRSVPLHPPRIPLVSSLTGRLLTPDEATDPEYWVQQLRRPVRFSTGAAATLEMGRGLFLECGPGRTLSSLLRAHPRFASHHHVITSMGPQDSGEGRSMLEALGRVWCAGAKPDWSALGQGARGRRVPLPTYPFEGTEHWFAEVSEEVEGSLRNRRLEKSPLLSEWFFAPGWEQVPPIAPGPIPAQVLVLGGDRRFRSEAVARLAGGGAEVTLVDAAYEFREEGPGHYLLDPERPEHFKDLFRMLARSQRSPELVIHAWNLGAARHLPNADRAGLDSVFPFLSILWTAQALSLEKGPQAVRLCVLTSGAQAIAGEDLESPLRAMTAAVCRVVNTEGDGLTAKAVDLPWPPSDGPGGGTVPADVMEEMLGQDDAPVIALRGRGRWAPSFLATPLPEAAVGTGEGLRQKGVYLIAGGLGGIGLEVARFLHRQVAARLVLVNRSALPPPEEWEAVARRADADGELRRRLSALLELQAAGVELLVLQGDVSDRRVAKSLVARTVAHFGGLNGVFHLAGVLEDGLLVQKTPASVDRVTRPKVQGTLALDEATRHIGLDCFVLFSSISAFAGVEGQSDYAAANAFQDAFATWRLKRRTGKTVSVNWSAWDEVGMASRLAEGQAPPRSGPPGRPLGGSHPILREVALKERGEAEVRGILSEGHQWLLDEHRLHDGGAVLPGAAFLELAISASTLAHVEGNPELRDVRFVAPCRVEKDAVRDIRVRLHRSKDGARRFAISTRASGSQGSWVEHCTGLLASASNEAPPEGKRIPALGGRELSAASNGDGLSRGIAFGPRWHNIVRRGAAGDVARLDLVLPEAFASDLDCLSLHPALVDTATAGAQDLLVSDDGDSLLLPTAVGRVTPLGPLGRILQSRVRLRSGAGSDRSSVSFDVQVFGEEGELLLDVADFTMHRVPAWKYLKSKGSVPAGERRPGPRSEHPSSEAAIRPEEGINALARLLRGQVGPQVVVAPAGRGQLRRRAPTKDAEGLVGSGGRRGAEETLALVQPSTPMQEDMARIAAELLGVDRIGVNERLEDLGMHSLLAVRLFNRLQQATGRNVPLIALMEAPTIEELALRFGDRPSPESGDPPGATVEEATDSAGSGPAGHAPGPLGAYDGIEIPEREIYVLPPDVDAAEFSSLVPLKPTGDRAPFFVVHARGGAVLNYQRLTGFVHPSQPIHGLQSVGLDGVTEPLESIEEMAAHYLSLVRQVQPRGPYFLGGGSLGGIVALEMALQLEESGEETALLAMFDSWGPQVFMDSERLTLAGHVRSKVTRFQWLIRERGWRRTLREVRLKTERGTDAVLEGVAVRWHRILQRRAGRQLPHAVRYQFVERVNLRALRVYRPRKWKGGMVLFRALDDPDFHPEDPTMGWSGTILGPIRVVECPGTHNTVMKGPVFGQRLSEELERARRQAVGPSNSS